MGMPISVTMTSSGVSRAINLDWMSSKPTSWTVVGSGTFTYTVEGAIDDLQQTAAANVAWFPVSSATTGNSSLNIVSAPLAGIRLNLSSASAASVTLRVLEGIGW